MPTRKKETKRTSSLRKFFKNININIGTVIFGALFLYMFISLIIYLTAGRITSYQVTAGPLSKNQTYTGLAIRDEKVITANSSGYVNYYARENAKIKKNGVVYTIGDKKNTEDIITLDDNALSKIRMAMAKFATNFDSDNYNDLYSFKYELEGNILQYADTPGSADSNSISGNTTLGAQTASLSPNDGIILYSTDGYESISADKVTADHFNKKSYHKENLKTSDKVSAGSNIYKIITNEAWSLIIPLSDKQMAQLSSRTSIRVKFLKDGATQVGDFSILFNGKKAYGKIDFTSGMIRYITDRFIDIELVTNTQNGLKIPMSSIVSKDFYTIPEEFESYGDNQNDAGFLIESTDKEGNTVNKFINTTLYKKEDGLCYVEKSDFNKGDKIVLADSSERYIIENTASLEGVYCINKGYAVFRQIIILDKDEEYCIVQSGQPYGISQYDHIVLNGNTVKEEDILY